MTICLTPLLMLRAFLNCPKPLPLTWTLFDH